MAGEIKGQAGELVDRLITLLNCDDLGEHGWDSVGFYAVVFIGGRRTLGNVTPDTGHPPVPGSVGEWERQGTELVSRDRYFALIRERLVNLITNGMDEAFLVRSLRDAIRRQLEHLTDVGKGDLNRAELRSSIQRTAEDPIKIAKFRELLTEDDPSAVTLNDEEITMRLRKMAEGEFLLPISPDEVLDRWAMLTHWDQHSASLLPDSLFDEWGYRRLRTLRLPPRP